MNVSKGVGFSIAMLIIMILEFMVLLDIHPEDWGQFSVGKMAFFIYLVVAATIQVTGMFLVSKGSYKTGGVLQIVASGAHLLDLVGIIGILGGLAAYRYPERVAEEKPASA